MNQPDKSYEWKVTLPLEKATTDDGRWIIRGIAAGADFVDKSGDEMLPEAIQKLAVQINEEPVPLRNQHKRDDIMEDMGEVFKAEVTPDFQLYVEAELDQDNPQAQYLWRKLGKGKKYGLSVRGDTESPIIEKAQSGYQVKHHSVFLKEISVTTRPFFTHSLGTVLRKAIDEADFASLAVTGENTDMADSITGETPNTQEAPDTGNATEQETPSPSEELVKSLMADEGFTTLIAETVREAVASQSAPAEEASEEAADNTEVEKAETEEEAEAAPEPSVDEIVKSVAEQFEATMDSKIQEVLSRIADVQTPAILEKSETEEANEAIEAFKNADPRTRLRVGLAAQHNQTDRL